MDTYIIKTYSKNGKVKSTKEVKGNTHLEAVQKRQAELKGPVEMTGELKK